MENSIPLTKSDFPYKDHWGHSWSSPSHEWNLTMSIPEEVGWLLYGIVRAHKPIFCLETGTHKGLSSIFIGSALRDNGKGRLVTLDIEDYGQEENIKKRGLESWIKCVIGKSTEHIPEEKIDFLFLDASHGYGAVKEELYHFKPYLSFGAIIAVDDCRLNPDQLKAIEEFIESFPNTSGLHILSSRGLYLIKYEKGLEEHDERKVDWFRSLDNFLIR